MNSRFFPFLPLSHTCIPQGIVHLDREPKPPGEHVPMKKVLGISGSYLPDPPQDRAHAQLHSSWLSPDQQLKLHPWFHTPELHLNYSLSMAYVKLTEAVR